MLVTLEGYDPNYDTPDEDLNGGLGWSIKKKYKKAKKKLKKKAKKVKKKSVRLTKKAGKVTKKTIKKVSKSPVTQAGLAIAVASVPGAQNAVNLVSTIKKATNVIQENPNIQSLTMSAALEKTGIITEGLTDAEKAELISKLPDNLKNALAVNYQSIENDNIKKLTTQELAKQKKEEPEKLTPAQIKAFNEAMSKSTGTPEELEKIWEETKSIEESPGDTYYKKGELEGDNMEYDQLLKTLATKIYSQNPYPAVDLQSWEFVQRIIKAYVYSAYKLSETKNSSYFYSGTTEAERQQFFGNLYIKIVYLYMKGFSTEAEAKTAGYDYTLRDQIWIVISLIRKFAKADATGSFMPFWKPWDYKEKIKFDTGMKINPLLIAAVSFILFKTL